MVANAGEGIIGDNGALVKLTMLVPLLFPPYQANGGTGDSNNDSNRKSAFFKTCT